jgi:glycerol-3-phosphate dehydrogenase (NAD(P)+)
VVVNAAKGLEPHTSKRLSRVFEEIAPSNASRYTVLAGPSVAVEIARKKPTALVAASASESACSKVVQALGNSYMRVETTADMAGAEWGGVLKNVYAIGLGLLDGLEAGGANVKAAFTSAAFREMKRLAVVLGAQEKTIDGPAGLGDLVATGFSADSHNRRLGELLGRGRKFEDAIDALGGGVPEGVRSVSRAIELAAQNKTEVPVAAAIEACLKNPTTNRTKFLASVWKAC